MKSLFVLPILLCLMSSLFLRAEESPTPEEEDKIAAKEDAEGDERMVLGEKTVFTGKLTLLNDAKPDARGVIGVFDEDKGKTYPIKSSSEEVLASLKPYDGKRATVAGKLRVNGKYLVIMTVIPNAPIPAQREKGKRNGL